MRGRHLNLAARPFVNSRPVTRVTAALAILAVLFLAADALLFWRYFRRGEDQREQLRRVEEEIAAERREAARLAGELAAVDLDRLNRRADYLNHKIAERTFGWGLLFDRLAAILPGDVRLLSLTPRPLVEPGPRRADRSAAAGEERVKIEIQGAARRDEAILELLDALFADPAFASPNLAREARQQGEVSFSLSVVYRPSVAAAGAADGDAEGEGPAAGEGATPPAGGPAAGGPMTATTTATATPAGGGAPPALAGRERS
jgi:Tfp pilus assembly protein PilN